jgi:hypothetical protein
MSECGRGTLTTSAVIPEVDWMIVYSDNSKYSCQSFCADIYREKTERRWQISGIMIKRIDEFHRIRRYRV